MMFPFEICDEFNLKLPTYKEGTKYKIKFFLAQLF